MLILSCLILSIGFSIAQTTPFTGTVVDDTGEAVIGASVVVKGTTVGTITDVDGKFTINVPAGKKTLVFSLIGMISKEAAASQGMRVVLSSDDKLLEEIVVTGYGTIQKASFTGAASVVSTSKLENVPSISLESKLAGAAAGVKLGSSTGQPGAVESIRIRGAGSIMASNEPLYVIDGVPMQTGNASGFSYSQTGNSILSTINSNDIENITIIKDAGAAALYGSRAANGVIVITTKSGKSGKTIVNLSANFGFSNMAIDYRPTLSGDDRRELLHFGLVNYANKNNIADAQAFADKNINSFAEKPWSGWADWKDLLTRTGKQNTYEISVQGGSDKLSAYSSFAYNKVEGITNQSSLDRISGRINVNYKATSKFDVGFNGMFTNTKQDVYTEGSGYASPIMAMSWTASPQDYPYNEDGTYNTTNKFPLLNRGAANPLYGMSLNSDKSEINRFLGSVNARYDIYKGIYAKETLTYDFIQTNNKAWWDPRSNDGRSSNGTYQRYMMNRDKLTSQTHLGFNNTINKSHNINALIGYEVEKYKLDYTYASGSDYPNPNKPEIGAASSNKGSSDYSENRMISYLGYLNYNYENKYYLGTSYRRDGSSKFSRDKRWGNFWSLSGSWRITQESFADSFKEVINDAKFRISYGVNGNLPTGNYDYLDSYGYGYYYNGVQGSAPARLAYTNLTWEKNNSLNIGLDFSVLNRVDFVIDWYTRDSKDLLIPFSISQTTGFSSITMNRGEMNNQGIELTINSRNITNNDFTWTTSFNLAHNKNELKKINGVLQEMGLGTSGRLRHFVGKPFSTLYAYEYAGVDPETGRESFYRNVEGHEREITTNVSTAKMVALDKVDPTIQGGLTNNFTYKDFDLGFTFTYSFGGHLYDNAAMNWLGVDGGTTNYQGGIPSYYKIEDTWQKPGDIAKLPQFYYGNTNEVSSRWIYSTDHIRLKNITLGYTLPKDILRSAKLSKVRFYASAVNLFTIKPSNLTVDPEIPVDPSSGIKSYGTVLFQTPALRTFSFGVDVTF